jgi:hypothetical protein
MKTLISILTLLIIALTGLISYRFFQQKEYNISSFLTIASYSSMVVGVYLLTRKRNSLQ